MGSEVTNMGDGESGGLGFMGAPTDIVSSVRAEVRGGHVHIDVFSRGVKAGTLVVGSDDARDVVDRLRGVAGAAALWRVGEMGEKIGEPPDASANESTRERAMRIVKSVDYDDDETLADEIAKALGEVWLDGMRHAWKHMGLPELEALRVLAKEVGTQRQLDPHSMRKVVSDAYDDWQSCEHYQPETRDGGKAREAEFGKAFGVREGSIEDIRAQLQRAAVVVPMLSTETALEMSRRVVSRLLDHERVDNGAARMLLECSEAIDELLEHGQPAGLPSEEPWFQSTERARALTKRIHDRGVPIATVLSHVSLVRGVKALRDRFEGEPASSAWLASTLVTELQELLDEAEDNHGDTWYLAASNVDVKPFVTTDFEATAGATIYAGTRVTIDPKSGCIVPAANGRGTVVHTNRVGPLISPVVSPTQDRDAFVLVAALVKKLGGRARLSWQELMYAGGFVLEREDMGLSRAVEFRIKDDGPPLTAAEQAAVSVAADDTERPESSFVAWQKSINDHALGLRQGIERLRERVDVAEQQIKSLQMAQPKGIGR